MKGIVRKAAAFFIFAALLVTYLPVVSYAKTVEWDGKSELEDGRTYSISGEKKLSRDFTIPEKTTLNIKDGGQLTLTQNMKLTVNGHLAVSIGGTLEIKKAEVNIKKKASLSVYGILLQYIDATLNIYSEFNIYNRGYFKGSGCLNLYPSSKLTNKGYIVLTPKSISTVTGTVENIKKAEAHLQGSFSITTSGALTSFGHMTIGKNGTVKNSGIFIIESGSSYSRFGTLKNTSGGLFRDNREKFNYEKMTVSILVDEPETLIYGIDVSYSQEDIDWGKVARSGKVDFAVIRAARGNHSEAYPMKEDDYFRKNVEGAADNGIDIGVYFYSYARNVEESRAEAEFLVSVIKDCKITYPVALDLEDKLHEKMSREQLTEIVEVFFEILMENGYYPMLYSYKSFLEDKIDAATLDRYTIWLAQWKDEVTYQGGYYMWQYSNTGKVNGIKGNVDLNIAYRDFPSILKRNRLNYLK